MKAKLISCLMAIIFTALFVAMLMYGKKMYRYECQDPNNYNKAECQPPLCEVSGYCTKYLIGEVETLPKKEMNNEK